MKSRKLLSIFSLIFLMTSCGVSPSLPEEKKGVIDDDTPIMEKQKGISFTNCDSLQMSNLVNVPLTFETSLKANKNAPDIALGTIVGNYSVSGSFINLEIRSKGHLALYARDTSGNETLALFNEYDVRNDKQTHIAVTLNSEKTLATLYVDGIKKQEINKNFANIVLSSKLCFGGDYAPDNVQMLKYTTLYSAALFSSTRTQNEISDDIKAINTSLTTLISFYDFTSNTPSKDLSIHHNDINYQSAQTYDASSDTDLKGIYFNIDEAYRTEEILKEDILTWELYIKVPYGFDGPAGTIIGSIRETVGGWDIQIEEDGHPSLTYTYENLVNKQVVFDKVDVRSFGNKWTHLTITNDYNSSNVKCYVDGALSQTVNETLVPTKSSFPIVIGGNNQCENENRFLGKISNISLYKTIRTDKEIAADINFVKNTNLDLVAHYQLDNMQGQQNIKNVAGRSFNYELLNDWYSEDEIQHQIGEYDSSIAVLGDIQRVTCYYSANLHCIFDWVINNRTSKNIKAVISTGDSTDLNSSKEWNLVKTQYSRFSDIDLPYVINQGNHDGRADINNAFNNSTYTSTVSGFYDNSDIRNSWRIIKIGDVKYIIFTLQIDATDAIYNWVGETLNAHKDCVGIMTLHIFMNSDYNLVPDEISYANADWGQTHNGYDAWNKCFKKYSNIGLVICGHEPSSDLLVRKMVGDNGNVVTTILVDPQNMDGKYVSSGSCGMICMLYFSKDGKTIQTEWFSTIKKQYFKKHNQTTIELFK